MSDTETKIEPYYRTATDIGYYFRDAQSISKFMEFFVEEAYVFSTIIKKNGNKIPYPIQYSDKGYTFQTDYQFLIHVLAKFVAKETDEPVKYKKVVKHFAILNTNLSSPVFESNRVFLMVILERMTEILSMQNWDALAGNKRNTRLLTQFTVFNPAVFELNGTFTEMKIVSFNRHKLDVFIKGWDDILTKYREFFAQENVKQVAYFASTVDKFWAKTGQERVNYFPIDEENLLMDDEKYEVVSS